MKQRLLKIKMISVICLLALAFGLMLTSCGNAVSSSLTDITSGCEILQTKIKSANIPDIAIDAANVSGQYAQYKQYGQNTQYGQYGQYGQQYIQSTQSPDGVISGYQTQNVIYPQPHDPALCPIENCDQCNAIAHHGHSGHHAHCRY